jgi:hypothetical protein
MRYPRYGMLSLILSSYGQTFGVLLLASMIGAAFTVSLSMAAWRLEADGVNTWAIVERLHVEERSCRAGKHGRTSCNVYTVAFAFVDKAGRRVISIKTVRHTFYKTMRIGKEVPVRYVPGDNDSAEFESGSIRSGSWTALTITTTLSLIAGYGLASRAKVARRMMALRDFGEARQATVTDVVQSSLKINGMSRHWIVWRDAQGGSGTSQSRFHIHLPPIGTEITIFADVRGGGESVWEGDSGSR